MTTTWPEYLDAAMRAAHIHSAADLARRAGVGDSVISRWMNGQVTPSLDNIRKVADVLGRPFLEVAVAAGAITTVEARMKDRPKPPAVDPWPDPDGLLERLARADRATLAAIRAVLDATDQPPEGERKRA